jgi:hypothetical protein
MVRNLLLEGISDALGWNIFAPGYGNESIGGIVLAGLGGGLGLQLARRWQASQQANAESGPEANEDKKDK